MDTKLIKLTRGKFAIVDAEDFEWLNQWKWYCDIRGYAIRHTDPKHVVYMHREILKTPKGLVSDHINQNKLDNRRENLRTATHSQNKTNRPMQANNKSGYKSVYWDKSRQKWFVNIRLNGKSKTLGRFENKEEEALAYNKKAKELFGEFAYFNQIGGGI